MKLRSYQTKIISEVIARWQSGKRRVMVCAPTGSGKTVLFAKIAEKHLVDFPDGRVWIVAHREEILLQAKQKIEAVSQQTMGMIKFGYELDLDAQIQIASIQSLTSKLAELEISPSLIIIDEAHHSVAQSYQEVLQKFPQSLVLGVTATPIRSDGQGFQEIFDVLVCGPSVKQLIEQEYLAPFKVFGARLIQLKDVKIDSGDYHRQSLIDQIDRSIVYGDLLAAYQKYADNTKTVIFCIDIQHSQATAAAYRAAGITAEHIDGDIEPKERAAILKRFRSGETKVLSNCELILEGFDLEDIQTVQIVRPTASLGLYLQMVGRVLRPHPDKAYARIIDHTSNVALFGLPDSERYWSLDPVPAPLSGWVEKCPSCQHIFRPLKGHVTNHRLMSRGIPRQFGRTICPNCHRNIQFLLRKSGLLFNAEVPAVIIEEDKVAIVEIRDSDQIKIKVGDRARHCGKVIQKSQTRIHADHLLLIDNILNHSSSFTVAIATLASLDEIEDFGIDHWQYIGAKMQGKRTRFVIITES
jgi:superfamily II DNA or RNA helicase